MPGTSAVWARSSSSDKSLTRASWCLMASTMRPDLLDVAVVPGAEDRGSEFLKHPSNITPAPRYTLPPGLAPNIGSTGRRATRRRISVAEISIRGTRYHLVTPGRIRELNPGPGEGDDLGQSRDQRSLPPLGQLARRIGADQEREALPRLPGRQRPEGCRRCRKIPPRSSSCGFQSEARILRRWPARPSEPSTRAEPSDAPA